MIDADTTGWTLAATSSNTSFFEVEPGIVAVVPGKGTLDTRATALENTTILNALWEKLGRGGVIVVFFDRMAGQDADARRIYKSQSHPTLFRGTAFVGGTLMGRAIGSFFLGINRPAFPVKLFGSVDEALSWARRRTQEVEAHAIERR